MVSQSDCNEDLTLAHSYIVCLCVYLFVCLSDALSQGAIIQDFYWYANGCCRVLALEQTQYSMLNVYLVFKNKVHKVQVSEKYVQTMR
jgi:hypothetical protein